MIKKISNTEAEIKFYGQISSWSQRSGKDFSMLLDEIEKKYKKLNIRLHCYGGEVFEGNVIYNSLINSSLEIKFIIDGVAASMGSIIMLAGSEVEMAENAFIMIHCPSGYTSGNAAKHLSAAKLLRSMERNFAKQYSQKTGEKESEAAKYFDGVDHWLDANEALAKGLVNKIIKPSSKDIRNLDKNEAKTLGAEALYQQYKSILIDIPKNKKMDKTLMIARYDLKNVTADSSDTAIMEAIDAKLEAEKQAKTKAQNELKSYKDSEIDSIIDAKSNEEGISMSDDEKENYIKIGKSAGLDALRMALNALKPRTSLSEMLHTGGGQASTQATGKKEDRKNWTWNDYQEKDPKALAKLEKENKETFNALYKVEFGELPE
ncbi:MAG: ATP-dependent Clp protease proteolytic subunit [Marinifilaceae bacterium]|jgi:ATP-dependent protease ClpP protease subunit|nr:ATP-dependent Clp protease proteolytic subunit [Marinifilaceae bacterium]